MGADIHFVVEIKVFTDSNWEFIATFGGERNYELFGKLAGVRSLEKPFYERRGLPFDIAQETKVLIADYWALGDHSFTYLTLEELESKDWGSSDFDEVIELVRLLLKHERWENESQARLLVGFDS